MAAPSPFSKITVRRVHPSRERVREDFARVLAEALRTGVRGNASSDKYSPFRCYLVSSALESACFARKGRSTYEVCFNFDSRLT
jgi:hypothetical protein